MNNNRYRKKENRLSSGLLRAIMPRSNKVNMFFWMLLTKAFLDISYEILSRTWEYYGFKCNPSAWGFILGWVGLFCLTITVNKVNNISNNSKTIYLILIFFVALPSTVLVGYGVISVKTFLYVFVYLGLTYFFSYRIRIRGMKKIYINFGKMLTSSSAHLLVIAITIVSGLIILFVSYKYAGLRFSISLDDVYDWRTENKGSMSVIARYLMGAAVASNITALSYFAKKRNWVFTLLTIIVQIMAFAIDGLKSTLFVLIFALMVLMFSTIQIERYIPFAFVGLSGLALVERWLIHSENILDVLIRRVLFLPGIITEYYVDFFSKNSPDFFLQGPLRFLGIKSSYSRGISYIIGAEYYVDGINFNSGLVSEAVANLGVVGILLLPILLSFCLRLFDSITKHVEKATVLVSAIYIGWFFMSSSITTALATHGIIVQLVFLYFISRAESQE